MNYLLLIGGIGVGFTVSSCLFFYVIKSASKGTIRQQTKNEEFNIKTCNLLEDRNKINSAIEKHLKVLAEWAENNWKQK